MPSDRGRRGKRSRNRLRLCVSDTGPGIPPAERERIFERFYRAEPSRHRELGADGVLSTRAGLGLAIARAVVHAHHGRIWADASPLGGAALYFTLPVDTGSRVPKGEAEPAPLDAQPRV